MRRTFVIGLVGLAAALGVGASSCGTEDTAGPTGEPSVAEKLSVVDGAASVGQFQGLLDCLTASGGPGTETEEKVGDTLVAAWQESSGIDTLWDFSKATASLYGC